MLTNDPVLFESDVRAVEVIAHGKILDRIDDPGSGVRKIYVIDTWSLRLNRRAVQDWNYAARQTTPEDFENEAAFLADRAERERLLDEWARELCADLGFRPEGVTVQHVVSEFFSAVRIAKIAELQLPGYEAPAPEPDDNVNYNQEDEI